MGSGVLPVAWGLLRGEHPTALALVGVALALIAVVIIGRGAEHDAVPSVPPAQELALGIGSGVGFGIVLILFSESATNSGMWPLLITRSEALRPVQVAMTYYQTEYSVDQGQVMAASMIVTLPIILLYVLVQRQFIEGVAGTGMKG